MMVDEHRYDPSPLGGEAPVAWDRLEDQLSWYEGKSASGQRAFKRVKLVQLTVGGAVPVVALLSAPPVVTAILAALVALLEGIQQLYQWQTNWVLYRSTAEALKHERFLFLSEAGPYTGAGRDRVLAERVEGLVSQEHAKWTDSRDDAHTAHADRLGTAIPPGGKSDLTPGR